MPLRRIAIGLARGITTPLRLGGTRPRDRAFVFDNVVLLAGSLLAGLLGYLYHLLLGRMLGPSSYGVVAASVALAALLSAPTTMVLAVAAKYAATMSDPAQLRYLFFRLSRTTGLLGAALALTLWLLADPIGRFLQLPPTAVRVLAPAGLLLLLQPVARGILQGRRRFLPFAGAYVLEPLLRVVGGASFVAAGLSAVAAVAAIPLGLAGSYVLLLWLLRPLFKVRGEPGAGVPGLGRYSLNSAATLLGLMALQQLDTLLAMHLLSRENAGLYAAVATVGKILFFGTGSVAMVMFPLVAARRASGTETSSVFRACFAVVAAGAVALATPFVVAPQVMLRLFYGPAFLSAAPALPVYAAAAVALALINVLLNYHLAADLRRHLVPLWAAVAAEILLLWAVRPGITGMALITAAVLGCLCVALLIPMLWPKRIDSSNVHPA